MDSASEHSEKGKRGHLGPTFNEKDVDVAGQLTGSDAVLDPQVAARLRCVHFQPCVQVVNLLWCKAKT